MEQSSNTEETAALFAARRLEVKVETDADSNPPPKKKRKLQAESDTVKSTDALAVAPGVATAVAVVSEVSLRVACLDGNRSAGVANRSSPVYGCTYSRQPHAEMRLRAA